MIEDGQVLIDKLKELRNLIEELPSRIKVVPSQVEIHHGVSDLSSSLGTVTSGEFRTGVKTPGRGFSGMRMAYPGMTYNSETWNLVGINNDSLQVGMRASDGKMVAGGGTVTLDSLGVRVYTSPSGSEYFPSAGVEKIRMGNLNGFLDYTSEAFGMAIGSVESFLKYTPEGGLQVRGTTILSGVNLSGFDSYLQPPAAGEVDGVNVRFTADGDYLSGRAFANVNGIWYLSPDDYAEVDRDQMKLSGAYLPISSDTLKVEYRRLSDNKFIIESPIGTMDGTNNYFYLEDTPIADTVYAVLNGVQLMDTTAFSRDIELRVAPVLLDQVLLSYSRFPGAWIIEEPINPKNGINKGFSFSVSGRNSASVRVFLNGLELYETVDYTLSVIEAFLTGIEVVSGITFNVAPVEDDIIFVMYSTDDYLY